MVDAKKKRRLIPSTMSRERTLVLVVLIAVVAIVAIVAALALSTSNHPSGGKAPPSSGGFNVPYPVASNVSSRDVSVTTFTFSPNSSGGTTFMIPVTNNGNASLTRSVNVLVSQNAGVPAPNQPSPSNQPPPTPVPNTAYQNSTLVDLPPGETRTVEVTVNTPPGFTINPSNVLISVT
jgi:flagellar basal body-associated protein FliL